METGDSDADNHPYGHRHEHRGGELYVRAFHNKKRGCVIINFLDADDADDADFS